MKVYAAIYNNDLIRKQSSSGGIFYLLSKQFDVVYGVSMSDDLYSAQFVRTTEDVSKIMGSKYLQAEIGDTYKNVKIDLDANKSVLFTGTPCQIKGLKLFLQKDYEKLFACDVICHGAPSKKLWKEYVTYKEKEYGKLYTINFRSKKNGWKNYGVLENDKFIDKNNHAYMRMFLRDYCLRPSCYNCLAKNEYVSDFTIGDFWGIEKVLTGLDDDKGISLILSRTEKGDLLFNSIKNQLKYSEVNYDDVKSYNPALFESAKKPKMRDDFYKDLEKVSFNKMIRKYGADFTGSLPKRIIKKVLNKLK